MHFKRLIKLTVKYVMIQTQIEQWTSMALNSIKRTTIGRPAEFTVDWGLLSESAFSSYTNVCLP